jgi:aryl-alcohol dehydrogenase-like predicted oxidoreductase
MRFSPLGKTLKVSKLCLGTMTFGEQNTEAEAHRQIDVAVDAGINLIDTAEMYPVPPRKETQGLSERFIGSWLKRSSRRNEIILASKASGPGGSMKYLRGGPNLGKEHLAQALDSSLKRLGVETIDLYQIHWPARSCNVFGRLGYEPKEEITTPIAETLETLAGFVSEGKIRCVGVSNETPWGVAQYVALAERHGWPEIVSIQNPFSLLNRSFEIGLAEFSHRNRIGLLAYSPLGFGVLSGKYLNKANPPGARLTLHPHYDRYSNPQSQTATERYVGLAKAAGIKPAQLALAFVNSRPFTASTIIGATNLVQLRENIAAATVELSKDLLEAVEAIHRSQPNPSP